MRVLSQYNILTFPSSAIMRNTNIHLGPLKNTIYRNKITPSQLAEPTSLTLKCIYAYYTRKGIL